MGTLKAIKERATLVIQKSQHFIQTGALNNSNSQSTGAVNHVGHSMVDGGRSPSPIPPTSRSHSPLPRKYFGICFSNFITVVQIPPLTGYMIKNSRRQTVDTVGRRLDMWYTERYHKIIDKEYR